MPLAPVHRTSGDDIADRRYAYAAAAFDEGDLQAAFDLAVQTIERAPRFAPAYALLGRVEAARGERDKAVVAFNEALTLEPEDAMGIRLELARLGAGAGRCGDRAGLRQGAVRPVCLGFDRHLTGALQYRGPAVIRAALDACAPDWNRGSRAIDLGCGTGLMALALDGFAGRLEGVDLSPQMLARARQTGRYAACTRPRPWHVSMEAGRKRRSDPRRRCRGLSGRPVSADARGGSRPCRRRTVRVHDAGPSGPRLPAAPTAAMPIRPSICARWRPMLGLPWRISKSASTRQDRGIDVPGLVLVLRKA